MFEVARQAQIGDAKLGDVFAFCSGLYFRGKLAYGQRFAQPPSKIPGVLIITPSRGLLPADTRIGIGELREFVTVAIAESEARFTGPIRRSAEMLRDRQITWTRKMFSDPPAGEQLAVLAVAPR
jgi:hypothetical protein